MIVVYDGTVTTEEKPGGIAYGTIAAEWSDAQWGSAPDTITVTFEGVEYVLPKVTMGNNSGYGEMLPGGDGPSFATYPVFVVPMNDIYTETVGTYSIKIETEDKSVFPVTLYSGNIDTAYEDEQADVAYAEVPISTWPCNGDYAPCSLHVTLDGVEHELEQTQNSSEYGQLENDQIKIVPYGDYSRLTVVTPTAGTHSITIVVNDCSCQNQAE